MAHAAMPWASAGAEATIKVSVKPTTKITSASGSSSTSLTQSRYSSTRESYWNTASNFRENWWHDEGKLLTLYDALRTEALENGGALDLNDVMMNRNKMYTLQAMMQVYPKSGYYDEAMESKLNVIGVQSGWRYDAGTGQLTVEMLDDIGQYYDNYEDWVKNLGKVYENGGAEIFQGFLTEGMGLAVTATSNYSGNSSDGQSSGNDCIEDNSAEINNYTELVQLGGRL